MQGALSTLLKTDHDRGMKRLCLIFYILFLFSPACSRIDLATTWADTYIFKQIDLYFDVSSMQAQFIKKAVREDTDKVSEQFFPQLARELERIEGILLSNTPVTPQMVSAEQEKLKNIFYSSLKIFEPSAQAFIKKLEARQLDTFKLIFNKKSDELQKQLLNPELAKKESFSKIKKEFEMWSGTVSEAQILEIHKFSNDYLFPIREELLNREKFSKEFLENYKSHDKRKKFISDLLTDYESMREPAYARALQAYQDSLFVLIAALLNKLTPVQKKYMIEILKERIEQLKNEGDKLPPLRKMSGTARTFLPQTFIG